MAQISAWNRPSDQLIRILASGSSPLSPAPAAPAAEPPLSSSQPKVPGKKKKKKKKASESVPPVRKQTPKPSIFSLADMISVRKLPATLESGASRNVWHHAVINRFVISFSFICLLISLSALFRKQVHRPLHRHHRDEQPLAKKEAESESAHLLSPSSFPPPHAVLSHTPSALSLSHPSSDGETASAAAVARQLRQREIHGHMHVRYARLHPHPKRSVFRILCHRHYFSRVDFVSGEQPVFPKPLNKLSKLKQQVLRARKARFAEQEIRRVVDRLVDRVAHNLDPLNYPRLVRTCVLCVAHRVSF